MAVGKSFGTLFSANEGNLEEPPEGANEHDGSTQEDPPPNRASNAVTRACSSSTFCSKEARRAVQPLTGFSILAVALRRYELRASKSRSSGTRCKKDATFLTPKTVKIVSSYNELVELQLENHLKLVKMPATNFIMKSSSMSDLIDSKSVSAINRVFQQIGFLSVQMSDKGKLYSSSTYRTAEFSFVRSCLFHGLDPYQEMVHSFNSREVMACLCCRPIFSEISLGWGGPADKLEWSLKDIEVNKDVTYGTNISRLEFKMFLEKEVIQPLYSAHIALISEFGFLRLKGLENSTIKEEPFISTYFCDRGDPQVYNPEGEQAW
ncbi:hypothetical protein LguiB_021202 [Lonicera macranthoides]